MASMSGMGVCLVFGERICRYSALAVLRCFRVDFVAPLGWGNARVVLNQLRAICVIAHRNLCPKIRFAKDFEKTIAMRILVV
jgi:hypothetical protein